MTKADRGFFSHSYWRSSTTATARPQSLSSGTIGGVVKDQSGAVLPGVTVEAASPALIERVRTAVSDDQGVYRIVDLRPGACHRHLHASRLRDVPPRRPRADDRLHGHGERRDEGRLARRDAHRLRRRAAGGHPERESAARLQPDDHRAAAVESGPDQSCTLTMIPGARARRAGASARMSVAAAGSFRPGSRSTARVPATSSNCATGCSWGNAGGGRQQDEQL